MFDSYARLSRMPDTGELEKIETQWADNRRVIERLGGVLGAELDDGLSAWKKGVRRPGWERLLERVQAGVSDGIVVWHTDRLFRQPRDLEALIALGDKGFQVASAHGARDLADPDDRYHLRIEVAHAARSSDDTSRRIKRRFKTYRENGVGHIGGPRRFGWPGRDLTWTPGADETDADRPMVSDASGGAGAPRVAGGDGDGVVGGVGCGGGAGVERRRAVDGRGEDVGAVDGQVGVIAADERGTGRAGRGAGRDDAGCADRGPGEVRAVALQVRGASPGSGGW